VANAAKYLSALPAMVLTAMEHEDHKHKWVAGIWGFGAVWLTFICVCGGGCVGGAEESSAVQCSAVERVQ